jgi:hypothetical protein
LPQILQIQGSSVVTHLQSQLLKRQGLGGYSSRPAGAES